MIADDSSVESIETLHFSGLSDAHILDLSKRITCPDDYLDLGIKVLRLPDHQVDSVWTKHRPDVNLAARELLQIWKKKQTNPREAFNNLCTALQQCEMNQLVAELTQWVKNTTVQFTQTKSLVYTFMFLRLVNRQKVTEFLTLEII